MLTKTTETAIQALLYLCLHQEEGPVPPGQIAERLGASPTYLAKVCTLLAKAGIVRAHRGVKGGLTLSRDPESITLLEILETCQGKVLGDYCQEYGRPEWVCAFHLAMRDVHDAVVGALQRWTLADLAAKPGPSPEIADSVHCRMAPVLRALDDESAQLREPR